MPKLSIVVPVYYNEDNLRPLYADLKEKLLDRDNPFEVEIVMVDDGSGDRSYQVMEELKAQDDRIHLYHLSRNFGSDAAVLCGLIQSMGDCAVVKCADLQEPTEMIYDMYEKWVEGNNVVLAVREGREEGRMQIFFANAYYDLTRKFAFPQMPKTGFDVYLLDRKVIEVLQRMDEPNSALDFYNTQLLFQTVGELIRTQHKAGLVVLHDPALALTWCRRLLLLSRGELVGEICPREAAEGEIQAILRRIYPDICVKRDKDSGAYWCGLAENGEKQENL